MITPIYRGCSACQGTGAVQSYPNPSSSVTADPIGQAITCEACKGTGIVPTGDFLYTKKEGDERPFLNQLEAIDDEMVKFTIKSRLV